MADRGHSVTLLSAVLEGDEPSPIVHSQIQEVTPRGRVYVRRLGFSSIISFTIVRELWLRTAESDVVHISFARDLLPVAACLMALLRRKPVILQPHGMLTSRASRLHRAVDYLFRPMVRRASVVVALTETERHALEEWTRRNGPHIRVVGNPLAADLGVGERKPGREAVFVARLEPRKRVIDFVEAARVAQADGSDTSYVIVGPDQGDLATIAPAVKQVRRLYYEGSLPATAIPDRLKSSGVFVLPSSNEPWGNVLVMALALGVPVVVCRSAALASLIEEYRAGIVVRDRSPVELAEAIDSILQDAETARRYSASALRLSAEKFSQDAISRALDEVYRVAYANIGTARN